MAAMANSENRLTAARNFTKGSPDKLGLSTMNFGGMGAKVIKGLAAADLIPGLGAPAGAGSAISMMKHAEIGLFI